MQIKIETWKNSPSTKVISARDQGMEIMLKTGNSMA